MNKPFTLKVQEAEQGIVEILNSQQFPAYVIKQILLDIIKEVNKIDEEEIAKYKEGDKKCKK